VSSIVRDVQSFEACESCNRASTKVFFSEILPTCEFFFQNEIQITCFKKILSIAKYLKI